MWLVAADIALTLYVLIGVREVMKKIEKGEEKFDAWQRESNVRLHVGEIRFRPGGEHQDAVRRVPGRKDSDALP